MPLIWQVPVPLIWQVPVSLIWQVLVPPPRAKLPAHAKGIAKSTADGSAKVASRRQPSAPQGDARREAARPDQEERRPGSVAAKDARVKAGDQNAAAPPPRSNERKALVEHAKRKPEPGVAGAAQKPPPVKRPRIAASQATAAKKATEKATETRAANGIFTVNHLVKRRRVSGHWQYLVRWEASLYGRWEASLYGRWEASLYGRWEASLYGST